MPVASGRIWDAHYLDGRTPVRRPARVTIGASGLEIVLTETGTALRWPLDEVRQTQGFYAGEQIRLERGHDLTEALLIRDLAFISALSTTVRSRTMSQASKTWPLSTRASGARIW